MIKSQQIQNTGNIFKDLPVVETPRLLLRSLTMRDVNDVFEYASMPEVSKHVTWDYHRNIGDSMAFVKSILQQYEQGKPSPWGIVYKSQNILIGTGGFHNLHSEYRKAEVGYAISAKFWNLGLMTEALNAMLHFGFDVLHLNRVEALCKVKNTASEKVMQKCNMKFEGILREHMFVKEEFHDLKIYSILKSEFDAE